MRKYSFTSFLITIALSLPLLAAAQIPKALDNTLRSNGRIYVVIAVLLIIFIGLILYLVRIEKKVDKLKNKSD